MTKKVLIAFVTNAGSTKEVAETIGEALAQDEIQVDVRPVQAANSVCDYDAIVVGGPMILGWHREAVGFVEKHQQTLNQKPVALFMTAMELTRSTERELDGVAIYQDPALGKVPKDPQRLSRKERFSTVQTYLGSVLDKVPQVKPVSAAFLAGKLDYGRLNLFQKVFVRLIIGAQAGDFRNWDGIRQWAAGLRPVLLEVNS